MSSPTVEDYVKQTYLHEQLTGGGPVSTGTLAEALSVVPGTVTSMLKRLARTGLARYEPYFGVTLTTKGRKLALRVLRRHRLIETWLVDSLGLDWSEVHEEAEQLEHTMSDKLLDRIDEALGRPRVDPHGDPIPDAHGSVVRASVTRLVDCRAGQSGRVTRVLDQNQDFLVFLDHSGLRPGKRFKVDHFDRVAEAMIVRPRGGQALTIGAHAAAKVLVEV